MAGYFVTGTRGGGKGAYAMHEIHQYLVAGKRVCTNMDLFLDDLLPSDSSVFVTRIPDYPTGKHLFDLGQAYDFNPKDPKTIDPKKSGLIVLDEISLFLDSKSNKDFKELVKFLMLSRKLGWDLILIGQNKDQVQDVTYKSLCDHLVICTSDSLMPIPILAPILRFFGLSGMMPDKHTAQIFGGRSELNDVIRTVPYRSEPYHYSYNSYQLFHDGFDYMGDKLVDMRANYSFVPANILTKTKFIDYHKKQLLKLTTNGDSMAYKKTGVDTGMKIKLGLLVVGLGVFMYFKNPMDNEFINPKPESPTPKHLTENIPQEVMNSVKVSTSTIPESQDFIAELFRDYRPRLSGFLQSNELGLSVIVDFYNGNQLYERLNLDDFHRYGYSVTPSGTAVTVKGKGFLKRVTSWKIPKSAPINSQKVSLSNSII